jgi:hypothetical protein
VRIFAPRLLGTQPHLQTEYAVPLLSLHRKVARVFRFAYCLKRRPTADGAMTSPSLSILVAIAQAILSYPPFQIANTYYPDRA